MQNKTKLLSMLCVLGIGAVVVFLGIFSGDNNGETRLIMDETMMHYNHNRNILYISTSNEEIKDSMINYFPKSSYLLSYDSGRLGNAYFVFPGRDSNKIYSFIKYMNR